MVFIWYLLLPLHAFPLSKEAPLLKREWSLLVVVWACLASFWLVSPEPPPPLFGGSPPPPKAVFLTKSLVSKKQSFLPQNLVFTMF